jgi:hypothetical protein
MGETMNPGAFLRCMQVFDVITGSDPRFAGGSGGDTTELANRISAIEGTVYEYELWESIGSGTSGTVSRPEGSEIRLDQYPNAGDCLIVKCDSAGRPLDELAETAGGAHITATFSSVGAYVLSGTPGAYPVAIIYQVAVAQQYVGGIPLDSIIGHQTIAYTDEQAIAALAPALAEKSNIGHSHAVATQSAAGFMASADKSKLDGVAANATANSTDSFLRNTDNHTAGSVNSPYSLAEKSKLAGVASGATANATDTQLRDRATHTGTQAMSTVAGLDAALALKADLVAGKIPAAQLPSYVDDVFEYANLASFPATGESGKIYTALDTNKIYRWSGSAYVEISASPGSTDSVTEGVGNLYFTAQRVRDVLLTGLSTATNAAIAATDSVLVAMGKLQAQITGHVGNTTDAHGGIVPNDRGIGKGLDLRGKESEPPSYWVDKGRVTGFMAASDLGLPLITSAYYIVTIDAHWTDASVVITRQATDGIRTYTQASIDAAAWAPWVRVVSADADGDVAHAGNIAHSTDNAYSFGTASQRASVVYAASGTINTSDAREKTSVTALAASEIQAAKLLAAEIGTYQWLASIEAKGEDARKHIGMTVQRAIEVMESCGLDPFGYGFICFDEWAEVETEDGETTQEAGNRYSFRPDELLFFIARGFEARLAALEAK